MEYGVIKDNVCINSFILDEPLNSESHERIRNMLYIAFNITADNIVEIKEGFSVGDIYVDNVWSKNELNHNINIELYKIKEQKISDSKKDLATFLYTHPLEYIDGKRYSVTQEKQTLLKNEIDIYLCRLDKNENALLMWNSTGEEEMEWLLDDLIDLSITIDNYVKPYISYQRSKEVEIRNSLTIEEVKKIIIDYNSVIANEEV